MAIPDLIDSNISDVDDFSSINDDFSSSDEKEGFDNLIGCIDEDSIDGETALHHACICFSEPLHKAALFGNAKIVTLLLEVGASRYKTNRDGKIPYELAKPDSEIKRILEGN
ncbi:protein phosphatase 1 regulatory subunit 16A-like [Impatiens glandulifera]|uniref:protein phosphatase 1 regulatory subunit 16A-like n=1 Tax=Impatiens glandulifera TaxID=253017 RepID=UPI001FB1216B|nr:protein phosphatase 1 regulatory subunit 16A-like [Impatiens glandulifera]